MIFFSPPTSSFSAGLLGGWGEEDESFFPLSRGGPGVALPRVPPLPKPVGARVTVLGMQVVLVGTGCSWAGMLRALNILPHPGGHFDAAGGCSALRWF